MNLGFERPDNAERHAIISPIEIAGERLGTVFIYKDSDEYDIDDIILCEYGTTVVSLEMLRAVTEENEEEKPQPHIDRHRDAFSGHHHDSKVKKRASVGKKDMDEGGENNENKDGFRRSKDHGEGQAGKGRQPGEK